MNGCTCIHPDPLECSALRHKASITLIACLDAVCKCGCHYTGNEAIISHGLWQQRKEHTAPKEDASDSH
jgi:hypothetical protein